MGVNCEVTNAIIGKWIKYRLKENLDPRKINCCDFIFILLRFSVCMVDRQNMRPKIRIGKANKRGNIFKAISSGIIRKKVSNVNFRGTNFWYFEVIVLTQL